MNQPLDITPKELIAAGVGPRMAMYAVKGQRRLSRDQAARVEATTGISRLHILYPDEFTREGYRIAAPADPDHAANG
jgi:hypothetical protein